MIDLESLGRRYGLEHLLDGCGINLPVGRLTALDDRDLALCATSPSEAVAALARQHWCHRLFGNPNGERCTLVFDHRRIGEALAILSPEEEPLPSYGRSKGYGGRRS